MATKNIVKFKNVPIADGAIHTYPSILRWNNEKKVYVRDENTSTWIDNPDGFADEAIAANKTHALVPVFSVVEVVEEKE